jgi:hypothetical protein
VEGVERGEGKRDRKRREGVEAKRVKEKDYEINNNHSIITRARTRTHQVQHIVISNILLRPKHFPIAAVSHSAQQHSLPCKNEGGIRDVEVKKQERNKIGERKKKEEKSKQLDVEVRGNKL